MTDAEKADVVSLGGLHVVGTERHESRRIDNQLRGRSGRQVGEAGVRRGVTWWMRWGVRRGVSGGVSGG